MKRILTESELNKAKEIRVNKRYDAICELGKILNGSITDKMRWSKCSKCLTSDGAKIDITTKKDKTTGLIRIVQIVVYEISCYFDVYDLE